MTRIYPKLSGLLPEMRVVAILHLARIEARGLTAIVTSGWRSPQEQVALYEQGRKLDALGIWQVDDHAHVVTNALPARAPHCRGAAYDLCPIVAEKCAWDRLDLFQAIADCARGLPLVWGGSWKFKDLPHFEMPNWRDLPLKETA